jgi:uncharacterized protein with HEPN domain
MNRKVKLYVDIINSINLIEEFLGPIDLFQQYAVDFKTKSAIERQLGIIGEAVKKIKDIEIKEKENKQTFTNQDEDSESETPMPYQNEIIGLRNKLIHGYDAINDFTIWSVLKDHINPLKEWVSDKLATE